MQHWDLLERAHVEHPERPAVAWNGTQLPWVEVTERCRALAAGLQARGVAPGDRVLLQRANEPLYPEMTFAVAGLGAVLVPASPRLAQAELADLVERCSPRLHITPDSDPDSWLASGPDPGWSPVPPNPQRLAQLYFTSGTTGGKNVYTIEVERALHEHPAVLEAAAYGVPSQHWGEELRAAVVLREAALRSAAERQ